MKRFLSIFFVLMMLSGLGMATYTTMTPKTLSEMNDAARMPGSWTAIAGNGSINNFAVDGSDYFLLINATSWDVTDKTIDVVNIMAGDNPPAFRSSMGNLSLAIDPDFGSKAGVMIVGPLETARFMNETGYIEVGSYMVSGTMMVLKVE